MRVYYEIESKTRTSDLPNKQMVNKTIFVCIAAIDEIDLYQTINSCFEQAKNPENVYVGVLVQNQRYDEVDLSSFKNTSIIKINSTEVMGVGATRQLASLLHNNQDYFLQIDAHMIFTKDWDERCISYYETLKNQHEKVILTGYAPNWYRNSSGTIIMESFSVENHSLTIVDDEVSKQPILGLVDFPIQTILDKQVVEQKAISYHFIFSEINFVSEFLPDPQIIYNGDEATLSLRMFSRGYKFFMPNELILYHLDKQRDSFYSNQPKWQPMYMGIQEARSPRENRINFDAYERVKNVFTGKLLGYYGSVDMEQISAYGEFVGINFDKLYDEHQTI
jgi:hypothetical protein